VIPTDRHARARRALETAESNLSWLDAHDTPTPPAIIAACRGALSRGAALALDELAGVDLETTLNVVRGALAAGPEALAGVERQLTREPPMPEPAPGFVPRSHWCRCGAHAVARRGDPCPERKVGTRHLTAAQPGITH
jgi:hypothetical protein